MVRLGIIFSFLFSLSAEAITPTGIPAIGLGAVGATTTPPTQIPLANPSGAAGTFAVFSLYGGDGAAVQTTANFYPLYKNGVAYQVTAGKTAYCFNITDDCVGLASCTYQFVSATASFAFNAASITGGVHQSGAAGKYVEKTSSSSATDLSEPGMYTFGASTFPGFQVNNGQSYLIHMDCYEN